MQRIYWPLAVLLALPLLILVAAAGAYAPARAARPAPLAPAACGDPGGPWALRAPVPHTLVGPGMTSDGTYAYAVGGVVGHATTQLLRYDPAANVWLAGLAPMPDAVEEPAAVYHAGKLYVFGGLASDGSAVNMTRIYDLATNHWAPGTPMPSAAFQIAAGVYNGKIYLAGGFQGTEQNSAYARLWIYDIATNSFDTTAKSLLQPVGGAGFGLINGHLYVAGGSNASGVALTTLYDFNPATNVWLARAPLPTAVNEPGSAVVNGKLWVFGGGNLLLHGKTAGAAAPATTNVTQIYDPATDTWTAGPPLSVARSYMGSTSVGPYVIAVGGYNARFTDFDTNEVSQPEYCTPTPTTTAPPTATATPPITATPTASPTPCAAGGFTDVHPTEYFYTSVQYLTQHSVIAGYGDCTFRPYNPATRGQMVKIVTLAFHVPAYVPPGGGQTFRDVPATHPFFAFIEAANHAGIVSGYGCGTGCLEFRAGNNVTRGQLSKIVASGAHWTSIHPATATFSDVPVDSPFYDFVETAVCHGVISGYADHTFRPNTDTIRGQIAKIVYNAVAADQPCGSPTPGGGGRR